MELELEAANGQAEANAEETDSDAEGDESQTDIQSMIESKLSGMLALRKKLFDKASDNIKIAQERYKKDYDRKRSQSEVCSFSDYCKYYYTKTIYCAFKKKPSFSQTCSSRPLRVHVYIILVGLLTAVLYSHSEVLLCERYSPVPSLHSQL